MATGYIDDQPKRTGNKFLEIAIVIIVVTILVVLLRDAYIQRTVGTTPKTLMPTKCLNGVEYWYDQSIPVLAPKYNTDGTVAKCAG